VESSAAIASLPALYERVGRDRVGTIARPDGWNKVFYDRALVSPEYTLVAVHSGADGDDGFVVYEARTDPVTYRATLDIGLFSAVDATVAAALWRFLLGVDLVTKLKVWNRPVDEAVTQMLLDQRALTLETDTDLWLRIVDVPAALAARTYGDAEPVVVEVEDRFLPANRGRYRIGSAGAERVEDEPDLVVDVAVLAMLYLGAWRATALAEVGRVRVVDPATPARADRLFATDRPAWCGTYF